MGKFINIKFSKSLFLVIVLNAALILFIYQSVLSLELQGDTWQYAWGYIVAYGNTLFNQDSWRNLHTSLAGSYLTFALIKDFFGLSAIAYYSISVILKFLTVVAFYFLIKKLTKNSLASVIASILLSATFAGVEVTHWVFNMYAYIGLIFITLSILIGLDLPNDFRFKKWLVSFTFACVGVWYATMRTNGIIPLIITWSFYKFITLKSKSSKMNLIFWIVGFSVFILIDKFLLGQMESDYSQKHIIGAGLQAFQTQIANLKYDFIFSPATNLGSTILPDVTWYSLNFPKTFSFLGESPFRLVILPSFLIFTLMSWVIYRQIVQGMKLNSWITSKFVLIFSLGLYWTGLVYLISTLGPLNFSSWLNIVLTLFGGYFMIFCLFLIIVKEVPINLKDLFLLSFLWSFVFLLLPEFQNGGPVLGTYQRYLVTTAPAVPMFIAGLIALGSIYKNNLFRVLTLLVVTVIFFSHATATKTFFDRKAQVHNRQLSNKIWQQFTTIVPNKPEYAKENPPTLWFEAADNRLDQETLFETLYFGFLFQASIKYHWDPQHGAGLYNNDNYIDLIRDIKKNSKKLDNFYAVSMENQSLINITEKMKEKINEDIQE